MSANSITAGLGLHGWFRTTGLPHVTRALWLLSYAEEMDAGRQPTSPVQAHPTVNRALDHWLCRPRVTGAPGGCRPRSARLKDARPSHRRRQERVGGPIGTRTRIPAMRRRCRPLGPSARCPARTSRLCGVFELSPQVHGAGIWIRTRSLRCVRPLLYLCMHTLSEYATGLVALSGFAPLNGRFMRPLRLSASPQR